MTQATLEYPPNEELTGRAASLFADERLDGYLPPGWEVEIYQAMTLDIA